MTRLTTTHSLRHALATAGLFLFLSTSSPSHAFSSLASLRPRRVRLPLAMSASLPAATAVPSWSSLQKLAQATPTGRALVKEAELRKQGQGSAHVQNTLRLFNSSEQPKITLFRDHAGWCPYCQKLMLLVEEKQIPCKIGLVPMRSYGDKPTEFLQKVPNGLLPAMEVNGQVITESQVIMQLLDEWHSEDEGFKPMIPSNEKRYETLARLERELFSWWCTLVFRPEGGIGGMFGGGRKDGMSGSMQGFMDCIKKVDEELLYTRGPWFFGEFDHPSMIDFIYISHVERMLASVAYWKGLNLRDPKWNLKGLNAWLDAFEKRELYLAFKSDYYTHIKDIPPQYGPGYDGGFEQDREAFVNMILGRDGSWTLPLSHDDPLQPLYRGPPLPLCVLQAMKLEPDEAGAYESCDPVVMARACRHMAAWKLSDNGNNVSRFAARGGPNGAKNVRKTFGAQLADPYADPDDAVRPFVDSALRVVCVALLDEDSSLDAHKDTLLHAVPKNQTEGVMLSMAYLRSRVGVPRDLPLASARYLRAYLSWGIDVLDAELLVKKDIRSS